MTIAVTISTHVQSTPSSMSPVDTLTQPSEKYGQRFKLQRTHTPDRNTAHDANLIEHDKLFSLVLL